MRIKLISPRMNLRPMDSEFKRVMSPSLSLLVIAGLTSKEDYVYIEDENVEPIHFVDTPDLVGITVNVETANRAYEIADIYRKRHVPVIVGGIHPSANPEEALVHADSVCIGEAETIWAGMVEDVRKGDLKRRYYQSKPTDLSLVPLPQWNLIRKDRYLYTNVVCATRGCPYTCDFCYNSSAFVHHVYRCRPIPYIIEEIRNLGTRHVMFIDDNLAGNIGWLKSLAAALTPLGLKWNAAVSANIGQYPDILDAMKTSGCQSLFIGFESINQKSLTSVHKLQNSVGYYEKLVTEIHNRGIMINASLVFGFDDDTPDVFDTTLAWLVAHKIETMTAHILTPYPGTRLFTSMKNEGRITDTNLSHYDTAHVVYTPKGMTSEELYTGYLNLYDQFYSLNNIFKRIPSSHRVVLPYLLFNFGYRKYGGMVSKLGKMGLMRYVGQLGRKLAYGID